MATATDNWGEMSFWHNMLGGVLCAVLSVGVAWWAGGEVFGWVGLTLLAIGTMVFWTFMIMQTVVEGVVGLVIAGGMFFALKSSLHSFGEGAAAAAKKTGEIAGSGAFDISSQLTYWILALFLSFFVSRVWFWVFRPHSGRKSNENPVDGGIRGRDPSGDT